MRLLDHDEPIDPEVAAALDAIDATLAGEPVDAQYAELAEIALLLSAERPSVPPAFAQRMDERVARRFASAAPAPPRPKRRWLSSGFWEASGALVVGVALIVGLVVFVGGNHGASNESSSSSAAGSAGPAPSSSAGAASPGAGGAASSAGAPSSSAGGAPSSAGGASSRASGAGGAASNGHGAASTAAPATKGPPQGSPPNQSSTPAAPTVQPPTSGRKVVQSAQLELAAPPDHIDDVAQQVYDVIGSVGGIVESSTVTQTGGPGGYADFQLSVPSGSLGQAMSRLSSLNNAVVVSRTDSSQDITDQYGAAQRALADARALRTSLLKQLANAVTTEQINSLNAQLHDAEASISSDVATLNRLNHSVGFSQLSLSINARPAPAPVAHGSGGFGIGRAAHDAERVLTVAAGGALIAIAALTPVALVVALAWWVAAAVRRRRREQALDSA
jgi:hypothetical protein